MTQYVINIILFSCITIPYAILYIRKYKLTPVSTFLIMEMTMFYGICLFKSNKSTGTSPEAIKLESIYVVALLFFIFGVEFSKRYKLRIRSKNITTLDRNNGGSALDTELSKNQMIVVWAVIILGVLLCTYYFIVGGANVFIIALRDFINGSLSTYKAARAVYRTVTGSGYIYQFRVVLLPILVTYLTFFSKKKYPKVITIPIFIFMIVSIVGTGQRNAFVFYTLIVILYYYFMKKKGIKFISKAHFIFLGICGLLMLVLLTIGNGRVNTESNQFVGALDSIWSRVFEANQGSAITAFRYIDTQKTVWGYDWIKMLGQVLPGKSDYLAVDNISYFMDYGSYDGTNPPCLWGSAWYNFHIIGITIYPFIIGMGMHNVYKTMRRKENKDRFYYLIYVALCVYFGIWTYGTPVSLFNHGIITLLILRWIIFKVVKNKDTR